MYASTLTRDRIKGYYENPSTYGSVLSALLADEFGLDWVNWTTETVVTELRDLLSVDLPTVNEDKIQAMALAHTSDIVYQEPRAFNAVATALNHEAVRPDLFDMVTPEEAAWALTELALNEEPGHVPPMSHELRRYIGYILDHHGIHRKPDVLSVAEMPSRHDPEVALGDDRDMYLGYFRKQQSDAADISDYVRENLLKLVRQMSEVPLQQRDDESWEKFASQAEKML